MALKILFFGKLKEITGLNEMIWSQEATDLDMLNAQLMVKFPLLSSAQYRFAVNEKMMNDMVALTGNETIALLPPFSGG